MIQHSQLNLAHSCGQMSLPVVTHDPEVTLSALYQRGSVYFCRAGTCRKIAEIRTRKSPLNSLALRRGDMFHRFMSNSSRGHRA